MFARNGILPFEYNYYAMNYFFGALSVRGSPREKYLYPEILSEGEAEELNCFDMDTEYRAAGILDALFDTSIEPGLRPRIHVRAHPLALNPLRMRII
jgi:hypothetical protein